MFLTILMLILPAAPKQRQRAESQAKPGGSNEVHRVLGSTKLSLRAPVGAELLLGASDRSQTEKEMFGVLSIAGSCAALGLSLRKNPADSMENMTLEREWNKMHSHGC